jgi:hypothetical protein
MQMHVTTSSSTPNLDTSEPIVAIWRQSKWLKAGVIGPLVASLTDHLSTRRDVPATPWYDDPNAMRGF